MKIKSNIQKIFAVLLLAVLAVGCTDEMADGGSDNTPIEEGKLVDVDFVLDKGVNQTVMTRSNNGPEVDDELLFLQYKEGVLKHAWYTDEDDDIDGKLEGWGSSANIKKVQLLSGKGYHVYVIANLELADKYYTKEISAKSDYDDRGIVKINLLENELGTESKLKEWRRNYSTLTTSHWGKLPYSLEKDGIDLEDEPIMFAVASNDVMKGPRYEEVYKYTRMATNPAITGSRVNDMVEFPNNIPSVEIGSKSTICATFYQPYAKLALCIKGTKNLKKTVSIDWVKVYNCPYDHSLVNGYSLKGKDFNEKVQPTFFKENKGSKDYFSGKKIEKGEGTIINQNFEAPIYLYENMAGLVADKSNPTDDEKSYCTYIEIEGKIDNKDKIIYRFILGNNEDDNRNCNVERNVFYRVTMTLDGNAGTYEDSWRVEHDESPDFDATGKGLSRLDAHASVGKIHFENAKGDNFYYIVVTDSPVWTSEDNNRVNVDASDDDTDKNDSYLYNRYAGGFTKETDCTLKLSRGNNYYYDYYKIVLSSGNKYVNLDLKYRQLSWFDYNEISSKWGYGVFWNTRYFVQDQHTNNKDKAGNIAMAKENTYYLHVFEGNGKGTIGTKKVTIKITQYPPIVVTYQSGAAENNKFEGYTILGDDVSYMERFDDDHEGYSVNETKWNSENSLGTGWTEIGNNNNEYKKQMFDYETNNGHMKSEFCFWANPYGPFENSIRVLKADNTWPYLLREAIETRYVIPWPNKHYEY